MSVRLLRRSAVACLLLLLASLAQAGENLLMARSSLAFPEAMLALQESIGAHGYKLSRVQRVDIGLTTAGFETDLGLIRRLGRATGFVAGFSLVVPFAGGLLTGWQLPEEGTVLLSLAEVARYTQENVVNGGTVLPATCSIYDLLAGANGHPAVHIRLCPPDRRRLD